jgi:hypothetical protein
MLRERTAPSHHRTVCTLEPAALPVCSAGAFAIARGA